jgi:hypothetical protein
MEKEFETMNIWALKGHRITVTEDSAKNGYEYDKQSVKDLIGKILVVERTSVSSSSTDVYIKGYAGRFNSVMFVDVDTQSSEKNKEHEDYKRWRRF